MKSKVMAWVAAAALLAALSVAGCTGDPARDNRTAGGAALGAGVGAVAGALLNSGNPWQGGVIGAALGAAIAGGTTYIAGHAARQAAHTRRPVAYTNVSTGQRVEAYPAQTSKKGCTTIREKQYRNGQLIKETERQVCN